MRCLSVLVAMAYCLWCTAQEDSLFEQMDTIHFTEMTIEADRMESQWSHTSHTVSLLTKKQIQVQPALSIDELLSFNSAIDIRRKGINGIQSDINIRGGSFEQALIMIDGVRMNDPQTGHHSMNIPIPTSEIERIEIIRGPASRRYGQNAYAGVVNVISSSDRNDGMYASLHGGSFGTYGGEAGLHYTKQNFTTRTSGMYMQSDGYRYNTDFTHYNLWNKTKFLLGNLPLTLHAGWMEKKFGANGFYASPDFTEQYEEVQTSILSLQSEWKHRKWKFQPQIYWRRNQDEYIFVRQDPSIYRNMHIGQSAGGEFIGSYQWNRSQIGFGIDGKMDHLKSNNLGDRDRVVSNAFADYSVQFESFDFTLGGLAAYFSDFGWFFYPGIDMGVQIDSRNKLFANWGRTARIPSYTDLYYQDPINLGNPDLQPEESNNYEIGHRLVGDQFILTSAAFYRQSNNLIDWVKSEDMEPWKPVNVLGLDTRGIETSLIYQFEKGVIRNFHIEYSYLENEVNRDAAPFSRYALDNLRHKVSTMLRFRFFDAMNLNVNYRYLDRINLDNYSLLDIRLSANVRQMLVFFDAHNILDTDYTESNLVPMPGFYWRVGTRYAMEF